MRTATRWAALAAATAAASLALEATGFPSPYLFAALLVGIADALLREAPTPVPRRLFSPAHAVIGVVLGAYLDTSSLRVVGEMWLPVTVVLLGTLVMSLGAGVVFSRVTRVDPATSTLGMVAGGASGIVAMADELGADDRLVAFMQYARVFIVVLIAPVVAALAFDTEAAGSVVAAAPDPPVLGDVTGWVVTAGAGALGAALAQRVRVPAGRLLGPMVLAGILALTVVDDLAVPPVLRDVAFALVGLQVGLRFTRATLREVGRLAVPVVVSVVALMAGCLALALFLVAVTDVTLEDAYLATTPGGLFAVAATAVNIQADTTFVIAVQALRLFVLVLVAPVAIRRLVGAGARPRL